MGPLFYSTRDPEKRSVSLSEAVLQGLAPDGGLYVPDSFPVAEQPGGSFAAMAVAVLKGWLQSEITDSELNRFIPEALNFPVPIIPLERSPFGDTAVVELFHGPTLSFKDFGARTMARLMDHFSRKQDQRLTVLVATSGDTGSAVADGFAGLSGVQVALLYPEGQVSPVQEMQLAVRRKQVRSFAVQGTFDDCQRMVKAAFADAALADFRLTSANSINIGRLLPQMLYYHWALAQSGADQPVICVPSGNLGNLCAGMMARRCGMAVSGFLAAHNANSFFPEFLEGSHAGFRASVQTLSNAMDVGAPSNFERLLHLFGEEDLKQQVHGISVSDHETLDAISEVHKATGYLPDPHTAVGLRAVKRYRKKTGSSRPILVMATAHPAKFPETMRQALGTEPDMPEALTILRKSARASETLEPTVEALREALMSNPRF